MQSNAQHSLNAPLALQQGRIPPEARPDGSGAPSEGRGEQPLCARGLHFNTFNSSAFFDEPQLWKPWVTHIRA